MVTLSKHGGTILMRSVCIWLAPAHVLITMANGILMASLFTCGSARVIGISSGRFGMWTPRLHLRHHPHRHRPRPRPLLGPHLSAIVAGQQVDVGVMMARCAGKCAVDLTALYWWSDGIRT